MTEIVIVGAGGFGREVLTYAQDLDMDVIGFVDDNPTALAGYALGFAILGSLGSVQIPHSVGWVIAVGDPHVRRRFAGVVHSAGGSLHSMVHPTAYVARSAALGDGSILCPYAMVASHAVIESNCAINTYASVGHDARVGPHSVFSPYSTVNGSVELGQCVFLGSAAVVLPGLRVGSHSKVSVGSAVTRHMEPGSLIVGNPAKGRVMFPVDD